MTLFLLRAVEDKLDILFTEFPVLYQREEKTERKERGEDGDSVLAKCEASPFSKNLSCKLKEKQHVYC